MERCFCKQPTEICSLQAGEEEEGQNLIFVPSSIFLTLRTTLPPTPNPPLPQTSPVVHFPQTLTRDIPHAHSLVQAGRHHQILRWMELSAHHVMIMASQHTEDEKRGEYSKNIKGVRYVGKFTLKVAVIFSFALHFVKQWLGVYVSFSD